MLKNKKFKNFWDLQNFVKIWKRGSLFFHLSHTPQTFIFTPKIVKTRIFPYKSRAFSSLIL